ncbi:FAD-linked oxidase [Polynucleobacter wuianus]|uniref:FAD-linked oxidase n=1 Tax=Polynucleobacter wuianus TaxID=1743168 RepID=A0A191UF75_9BURK|nr:MULTISPECIES: FAD-binding oxidoreductase [Polynucleobacter]ANI99684.1 FAD-linked oxidase [Polynucleobacter wuianus]MBU3553922.1 FAD-binding oxidoreductase [Polynucleobacter sp. MWH-Post4-6-1]MBU3611226.1 FAD-binding oxidoreductase [Polynucleobacter wuianus]
MKVKGWGGYPTIDAKVLLPPQRSECWKLIEENTLIPRGQGRSYGDSANSSTILQTDLLNHVIQFNELTGLLTCESGITIREILKIIVPKGWFIPVTPGTSFVSIGGAIASDIHGKNHHLSGTFTKHIRSLELMVGTGEILNISELNHTELFRATCGGMGLTGLVLSATIQLMPISSSQIYQKTIKANCLEEVCELFDKNSNSTYSVAWIDCLKTGKDLGRSLLMLGEHAKQGDLKLKASRHIKIPIQMPSSLLNPWTAKIFNTIYFNIAKNYSSNVTTPLESYFYPLDKIHNWNRLYGKHGFIQYQFVVPKAVGQKGLKHILRIVSESGKGSFLAVLKAFGPKNENYLSFPIEGYTLALDFKLEASIFPLIELLDKLVLEYGGRIYLAKDGVMNQKTFRKSYHNWEKIEEIRSKYDCIGKFRSTQSIRLGFK